LSAIVDGASSPNDTTRTRAGTETDSEEDSKDGPASNAHLPEVRQRGLPVYLCVVADDDQAIYQWRGSDVPNMLEFTKRYKSATSLLLSANRRSCPTIIATANAFAESISPRLPKKMKPYRPAGSPEVHCWSAETVHDEAGVIADTIEELHKIGYRYKDPSALVAVVAALLTPALASAYGACHVGCTHVGPNGVYNARETAYRGTEGDRKGRTPAAGPPPMGPRAVRTAPARSTAAGPRTAARRRRLPLHHGLRRRGHLR
jgi:hypothetical protein